MKSNNAVTFGLLTLQAMPYAYRQVFTKETGMRNILALMVRRPAALVCGLTTLFATIAFAQSANFNSQIYPFLGNTHVAADFNGDGKRDLAGSGANAVSVMLNNGDGTFGPKTNYPLSFQTQDVAAADFTGDGKLDLAVTLNDPNSSLAVLIGTAAGTFNAPVYFANSSGFDSPSILALDVNNDGKADVVILHSIACFTAPCMSGHSITVLLGNGNGTFQFPREIDVGVLPHSMAAGDFNRDGRIDLAIGGERTELRILLGLGNGSFLPQPTMTLVPGGDLFSACNDIDIGDFNGDGIQDMVVPLGNGRGNAILIGTGNGTFQVASRIQIDESFAPLNTAVADYNGDGFLDIARAMGDGTNGLVEILNGNGNGTFQPPVRYLVPPPQSSIGGTFIVSNDLNGDTKSDIVLAVGGASPSLRVMLNAAATPPPPTPPPTVTLSSVALSPNVITGGGAVTGTVTLSAPPQAAVSVVLSSNRAAATLPASVSVAAGNLSATFQVNTAQVSAQTIATITATLNGISRLANLTINPVGSTTDTVSITRAEYTSSQQRLRIEATSTSSSATLKVYVSSTNALIGTLNNDGGGRYRGEFSWPSNPQNVTVRSSLGGSATRGVLLK